MVRGDLGSFGVVLIAHKISVARFKATHNCAASPEYYKVNWFSLPLLYRLIQVKREDAFGLCPEKFMTM